MAEDSAKQPKEAKTDRKEKDKREEARTQKEKAKDQCMEHAGPVAGATFKEIDHKERQATYEGLKDLERHGPARMSKMRL